MAYVKQLMITDEGRICKDQCCIDCDADPCAYRCQGGMDEDGELQWWEIVSEKPILLEAIENGLLIPPR